MSESTFGHIKFLPWVGKDYQKRMPWGFRVMVLGESHYDTDQPQSNFTEYVVDAVVNGRDHKWRTRIFTKTPRLFYLAAENRRADRAECRAFWHNVLFYNFVQDYVGRNPRRDRLTPQMWERAVNAFEEVIGRHHPELVLVLGKELSDHLLKCPSRMNPHILFVEVDHPQSFGWTYETWMPRLKDAIQRLKDRHA